jgi:uncharacterized protein
MSSLQDLLHKEDKLLSLLEASAQQARESVQALIAGVRNSDTGETAQDLAYSRIVDRKITDEIREELYSTSTDVVDREDIERLSKRLYKIPKIADKFRERFLASPDFVRRVDFSQQLRYLEQAAEIVAQMVGCLKGRLELDRVKALNEKLQSIEGAADKHMLTLYKELYGGKYTGEQVVALKELYELLERLVDRNRDAGNIIFLIVMKNS